MKKLIGYSSAVGLAALVTGCIGVGGPIVGSIYSDVTGPVAVTESAGSSKVGEATASGIIGFATGDASIKTAAANGGITKIHHVDMHSKHILGIWGEATTIVYGD
ncbi:MAG TPA: TRL-like family protein [Candidatus Dormibacteraeota bacterium]|nr:TRL-like family protein [Candidatus Dormibacteraeota bacterium]